MHTPDHHGPCSCTSGRNELELLLNRTGSNGEQLDVDVDALAAHLPLLDECVAMTANGAALISELAAYSPPTFTGDPLVQVPDAVALRMHRPSVRAFVAMDADEDRREPPGLWMFDEHHSAVHRGYLVSHNGALAMDMLRLSPRSDGGAPPPHSPIDWTSDQLGTIDTILAHGGSRRGPGQGAGIPVPPGQVLDLLCYLCDHGIPLSVGVPNRGCLQLHTGALDLVEHRGNAISMVSGACNVVYQPAEIAEVRISRPHGVHGTTSMVQLHTADGNCVALLGQIGAVGAELAATWEKVLAEITGSAV